MWEVFQALGILPDDREGSKARMSAVLASSEGRQEVRRAIEQQQDHFEMLGLQLGFTYESGAVVPDGSEAEICENPIRDYVATTRPGARLPHAWVLRDGARVSTLDLLGHDRFTLIAGARSGSAWQRAAMSVERVPLQCLVEDRDFVDVAGHWASVRGISSDGALLVRPDQHVAWRCPSAPSDPAHEIRNALLRIGV
jgi:2,4-dichlorophenol 6-monooxygenase